MKKKLLIAAAIVVIAVLGLLIIATPRTEPEPPLPNPNGYDDFVKATALVQWNPPDWQAMKGEEQLQILRQLVATNRAAIELVRIGLGKECRMAIWEVSPTNAHFNEMSLVKELAKAFAAASKLALIEGRTNEAAALATDGMRLGSEWSRGGVVIDGLVGIAIEAIALKSLKETTKGLDLESTLKTIAALEAAVSRNESYDEVFKRERRWARHGRFGRAGLFTQLFQYYFRDRKSLARALQKFTKIKTDIRQMQIQLAVHAFELDHGKPPATARDLVPQYLKTIPLDPATGNELPLN